MTIDDIVVMAQDLTDQQTTETTGKFSSAWWFRQVNRVKDIVAQETGYYRTRHRVSTVAGQREVTLPATICWGIQRVTYNRNVITAATVHSMDLSGEWESSSPGTPSQYLVRGGVMELDPPPDRTVTVGSGSVGLLKSATGGLQTGADFAANPLGTTATVGSTTYSLYMKAGAGDVTQTVTIYGTTNRSSEVIAEEIELDGSTTYYSTKDDWGLILAVKVSAACATDLVFYTAADAAIVTIAAGGTSKGMTATTDSDAGGVSPRMFGSSTSTAFVGVIGTDVDGSAMTDNGMYLSGTATVTGEVEFTYPMDTVTYLLLGNVPSTTNVTILRGAALELYAGTLPSDMTTTQSPTPLPTSFHPVLAYGAACLADMIDLYDTSKQQRMPILQQMFMSGMNDIKKYYSTMQGDSPAMQPLCETAWQTYQNN